MHEGLSDRTLKQMRVAMLKKAYGSIPSGKDLAIVL